MTNLPNAYRPDEPGRLLNTSEMVGKTVKSAFFYFEIFAVVFTDGSFYLESNNREYVKPIPFELDSILKGVVE